MLYIFFLYFIFIFHKNYIQSGEFQLKEHYINNKPNNEIGPSVSAFDLLGPVVKAELILYC